MKYNKIIKITVTIILINLFFIDEQHCCERPPVSEMVVPLMCPSPQRFRKSYQHSSDVVQPHHGKNYSSEQHNRDALRDRYLDKYANREIVAYWTSDSMLERIKAHEWHYKASKDEILDYVIELDISLKDDRDHSQQMLYRRECHKIISNEKLNPDQKNNLHEYMQQNQEKVKDELWLQHMYACKDGIHKEIEKNKRVHPCQESYCAWPYIREIARLRKFS